MPELSAQEKEEVEIQIKYEGYIKMQEEQVEKFKKMETKLLPEDIDYSSINGLCLEPRQKLCLLVKLQEYQEFHLLI